MKRLMTVAVLCVATLYASDTDKKSDKTTTTPKAVTIPKDAIKNPDGTYSYTDKDGKKWIYASTPFGVIKSSLETAASQGADQTSASTKVIDKGDTVRFERPGPFGPVSWEKKKSELTDEERRIVDAQTAKPDAK